MSPSGSEGGLPNARLTQHLLASLLVIGTAVKEQRRLKKRTQLRLCHSSFLNFDEPGFETGDTAMTHTENDQPTRGSIVVEKYTSGSRKLQITRKVS